jgi:glycosyltransferase involved in cell wall biosynthesis
MLVSIVITSYNYGRYISRCIESCLAQDLNAAEFEVIVVDDCSTDDTQSVLSTFRECENLRILSTSHNRGVAGAANLGIREASGEYVTRVDADDYISPALARKLADYLGVNQAVLGVTCDYSFVDENDQELGRKNARTDPIACGIMYRRSSLIDVGLYSVEWRHREEEELRARLGELYILAHSDELLYYYVMHSNNKTRQQDQMKLYRQRLVSLYG